MIDRSLNYGRHHIRAFLRHAQPFRTVLDLGAGTGADLELAAEIAPGVRQLAVEVHRPYINVLQSKGVEVAALDIERDRLPCGDSTVDVVIANQILEHTKDVFWILHEVTRILPVGGHFILGVPNLAALHNRILLTLGHQPSPIKTASAHVRGFTKRDLLEFLDSAFPGGYRLKVFGGSNFYPFPPVLAKPLAAVFPNMAWGIFMMLEKQLEYEQQFLEFPENARLETSFYLGPR